MAGSKWTLFVAGLFIFVYSFATLYYIGNLLRLYNYIGEPEKITLNREKFKHMSNEEIAEYTTVIVMYAAVAIASIFLYVGLRRKIHTFIVPWLFISILHILLQSLVIFYEADTILEDFSIVVPFLFVAGMWYPIFKQYKAIRYTKCNKQQLTTRFSHLQQDATPVDG